MPPTGASQLLQQELRLQKEANELEDEQFFNQIDINKTQSQAKLQRHVDDLMNIDGGVGAPEMKQVQPGVFQGGKGSRRKRSPNRFTSMLKPPSTRSATKKKRNSQPNLQPQVMQDDSSHESMN